MPVPGQDQHLYARSWRDQYGHELSISSHLIHLTGVPRRAVRHEVTGLIRDQDALIDEMGVTWKPWQRKLHRGIHWTCWPFTCRTFYTMHACWFKQDHCSCFAEHTSSNMHALSRNAAKGVTMHSSSPPRQRENPPRPRVLHWWVELKCMFNLRGWRLSTVPHGRVKMLLLDRNPRWHVRKDLARADALTWSVVRQWHKQQHVLGGIPYATSNYANIKVQGWPSSFLRSCVRKHQPFYG